MHQNYILCLSFFISCLFPLGLFAQPERPSPSNSNVIDNDQDLQYIIENFVEANDGEDFSFDTQFEILQTYLENPLNLNTVQELELAELGILSALQMQAFFEYRRQYQQFFSFFELQSIPTFDRATIFKLLPYITLDETKAGEPMDLKRWLKYSRREVFARYRRGLERAQGFQPLEEGQTGQRYAGDPNHYYLRFRSTYRDRLSFGLTMEKDPGEEFFRGSNRQGFDFYSAHLYVKDPTKHIKALALGDYQVFLGQGLVKWGGFGIRKSPSVLNIRRVVNPIRGYTSVNEALFSRGAAIQFTVPKLKNVEFISFVSYRQRDAGINNLDVADSVLIDSLGEDFANPFREVGSLPETGFHRTPNELAQKGALGVFDVGGSIRYMGNSTFLALNAVHYRFSEPFEQRSTPYQTFNFTGSTLTNIGFEYRHNWKTLQFFGESALSSTGGLATLNGLLINADSKINFAILQRHYSARYQSFMGNAFGETQQTANESGLYFGTEIFPAPGWKLSMFADVYRFPWMRFALSRPAHGWEHFLRLEHTKNRRLSYYTQYRIEERPRDIPSALSTGTLRQQAQSLRQYLRFHLRYVVNENIELRSRVEFSFYKFVNKSRGVIAYQDIVFKASKIPLKTNMRIALFDTDDFDTRIYAYENDMLYQFSVPAYFGRGMRFYWNLNYSFSRSLSIWLRFSQTYFSDRDVISSGLNAINGPRRSEIKAQIRWKF